MAGARDVRTFAVRSSHCERSHLLGCERSQFEVRRKGCEQRTFCEHTLGKIEYFCPILSQKSAYFNVI